MQKSDILWKWGDSASESRDIPNIIKDKKHSFYRMLKIKIDECFKNLTVVLDIVRGELWQHDVSKGLHIRSNNFLSVSIFVLLQKN